MAFANPRHDWAALVLATLLGASALLGCGDDPVKKPTGPGAGATPSSQFTGTFLSGFEAGLLSVSVATTSLAPRLRSPGVIDTVVTAYGTMSVDGGEVVNLTGSYDTENDSLHLVGQSWTLRGQYHTASNPPVLEGTYDGPQGSGTFACWVGNRTAVSVFCGTFQSTTGPATGLWNVAISGAVVLGMMAPDGASAPLPFSGTVTGSGTIRSLSFSRGWGDPLLHGDGEWNTATRKVAGTWTYGSDAGTWEGEACLPGTTGSN